MSEIFSSYPFALNTLITLNYISIFNYFLLITNIFYIYFNINFIKLTITETMFAVTFKKFYFYSLLFSLLSLAGIPPFSGFFIKFYQLTFFLQTFSLFTILLFIVYNIIIMYFYFLNFINLLIYNRDS